VKAVRRMKTVVARLESVQTIAITIIMSGWTKTMGWSLRAMNLKRLIMRRILNSYSSSMSRRKSLLLMILGLRAAVMKSKVAISRLIRRFHRGNTNKISSIIINSILISLQIITFKLARASYLRILSQILSKVKPLQQLWGLFREK
jgi:hypothetical protein